MSQMELGTQELKYSSNSSSDSSDNELTSEEESDLTHDSIPDLAVLKPYDHEPVCESALVIHVSEESSESESETEEQARIGNINWCKCGNCKPMKTYAESLCCQDTNEVPEENFAGTFFFSNYFLTKLMQCAIFFLFIN